MTSASRIPLVDQLRGLAALSVAWFHLTNGYGNWVSQTGSMGWLGVEAFFVISGFVIPYSLSQRSTNYHIGDFPHFFARRIIRLEPPYIASIALVIAIDLLAASTPLFRGEPPHFEFLQVMAHFLYLIPLTGFAWIQPVYWTLAYEFVFYLAIGLLFPFVGLRPQRWAGWLAAVLVVLLVSLGVVSHLVALFVMGFSAHRRLAAGDHVLITLGLLVISALAMIHRGAIAEAAVGVTAALVILFHEAIPAPPRRVSVMLTGLGAISYSLYLVHIPVGGKVVNLGRRFVDGGLAELALSAVALVVSVGAAWILWRAVERPATRAAQMLTVRRRRDTLNADATDTAN